MASRINTLIFPLLLVCYEMAAYLSNDMYLPALPSLMRDLQISQATGQLTLTMWFLGTASMHLILGPLSDRYGRRPVLLTGGVLCVIAGLVCAMTTRVEMFLFARFIQGAVVGTVVVPGYAAINELFEDRAAAMKTLAWMGCIIIVGPAFGPFLGALFLMVTDWRFIFWFLTIWPAVLVLALYRYMPETNLRGSEHPIHLLRLLSNYGKILRHPAFLRHTLTFCCVFCGLIIWIAVGSLVVVEQFHLPPMWFGVFQFIIFGGFTLGTRSIPRLVDRFSSERIITWGTMLAGAGGLLSMATAMIFPNLIYPTIAALAIYALGAGLSFSPLHRSAIESCDAPMGARMALFFSAMSVSGVAASMLVSLFYKGTLISFTAIIGISAIMSIVLYRRWRRVS